MTNKKEFNNKYDSMGYFIESNGNLAKVRSNGKYGYINRPGKLVIPMKFDSIFSYLKSINIIILEMNNDMYFIDIDDNYKEHKFSNQKIIKDTNEIIYYERFGYDYIIALKGEKPFSGRLLDFDKFIDDEVQSPDFKEYKKFAQYTEIADRMNDDIILTYGDELQKDKNKDAFINNILEKE